VDCAFSNTTQKNIYYLARSIEKMATCEAVYFCRGWQDARGCKIEHSIALAYGLDIIYEDDARKTEEYVVINGVYAKHPTTESFDKLHQNKKEK
jgi:hypothetical protein